MATLFALGVGARVRFALLTPPLPFSSSSELHACPFLQLRRLFLRLPSRLIRAPAIQLYMFAHSLQFERFSLEVTVCVLRFVCFEGDAQGSGHAGPTHAVLLLSAFAV